MLAHEIFCIQSVHVMGTRTQCMFVDEESVVRGVQAEISRLYDDEKNIILRELPVTYVNSFGIMGFCKERPVQVVSPYDIPLGKLRKAFFEQFYVLRKNQRLEEMPYLLYWFDSTSSDPEHCVTLQDDVFIDYKKGQERKLDHIPREIQRKLLLHRDLTKNEQIVLRAYEKMENAAQLEPSQRTLPFSASPDSKRICILPHPLFAPATSVTKLKNWSDKVPPQVGANIRVYDRNREAHNGRIAQRSREFFLVDFRNYHQWIPLMDHEFDIVDCDRTVHHKLIKEEHKVKLTKKETVPVDNKESVRHTALDEDTVDAKHVPTLSNRIVTIGGNASSGDGCMTAKVEETSSSEHVNLGGQNEKNCASKLHDGNNVTNRCVTTDAPKICRENQVEKCREKADKQFSVRAADTEATRDTANAANQTNKGLSTPKWRRKRIRDDGFMEPAHKPRKLPDGTFSKPSGGVPKGYVWSFKLGLWAPLSQHPQPNAKRTKTFPAKAESPHAAKSMVNVSRPLEALSNPVTKPKNTIARDTVGECAKARSLPGPEKKYDINITMKKFEDQEHLMKLVQYNDEMLSIVPLKDSKDPADIERCERALKSVEDLTADDAFFKMRIHKYAYKFIGHPTLGILARKMCSRWKQDYLSMQIDRWKKALEENDLASLQQLLPICRLEIEENNAIELPGEFWEMKGIDDLVDATKDFYALLKIESVDLRRIEEHFDCRNESAAYV